MKILHGIKNFKNSSKFEPCVLTMGNFDGVHLGHQAIFNLLKAESLKRNIKSCVVTFEPHPRDYFAKLTQNSDLAPARISTLRDKLTKFKFFGIDQIVILPFNQNLANLEASDFIKEILVKTLNCQFILIGEDFYFGKNRSGNYDSLVDFSKKLGFDIARMKNYEFAGERISSTKVRQALADGNMKHVEQLLGCSYSISGHVVHGNKLGRTLAETQKGKGDGFRTLNLHFKHFKPAASGVFVTQVWNLTKNKNPIQGVANLGVRPAIHTIAYDTRFFLETHCFNWPKNLNLEGGYGKIIRVELLHKLHDEKKYENLEKLTQGIAKDYQTALSFFK